MKILSPIPFALLAAHFLSFNAQAQIAATFGGSGAVTMDFNHVGQQGPIYSSPAPNTASSAHISLSDDHTLSLVPGYAPWVSNPDAYLKGSFAVNADAKVTQSHFEIDGALTSSSASLATSGLAPSQLTTSSASYYSSSFVLTQAVPYTVTVNANANPSASNGYIASVSLSQGASVQFNIGIGAAYGSGVVPSSPGSFSGTLQPGTYLLQAQATSFAGGAFSSFATTGFTFEIGPPSPPRLFALAVGEYDGDGVNGYLDAQKVFNILQGNPNFASPSLGNTTAALPVNLTDTYAKDRIALTLSGMAIRPQDTLVFYFSGHGNDAGSGHQSLDLGGQDLWDYELAALIQSNPNLLAARKLFILDSCHSGGFAPELLSLNNSALLAAASEAGLAYSNELGRGIYTEDILLPYLYPGQSFGDLMTQTSSRGVAVTNNLSGITLFLREAPGSTGPFSFSGTGGSSQGFDITLPIMPVPEPGLKALSAMALVVLGSRRRRE